MNIYCSSDGTIFHVDTERIYQGSAGVNIVRFIGQFASTAQVLVSYKLPNGVLKGPKILTPIATLEEVKTANGGVFSVWETVIGAALRLGADGKPLTEIDDKGNVKTVYALDYTITENYGTVEMQFFVYPAGETLAIDQQIYNVYGGCLATASTTFTVEKGVPITTPTIEELTTTDGERLIGDILGIVSSYATEVENQNKKINDIEQLAVSKSYAFSIDNYSELYILHIFDENGKGIISDYPDRERIYVGQDLFVKTPNVPDLWVSGIGTPFVDFEYTTDEDFVKKLLKDGSVKIGYIEVSPLESKTSIEVDINLENGDGECSISQKVRNGEVANKALGAHSVALGKENTVTKDESVAIGDGNMVYGANSIAMCYHNSVESDASFAAGGFNKLSGEYGIALGYDNTVTATAGFAGNGQNTVGGSGYATAFGHHNNVTGYGAFVTGEENTVSCQKSFAAGGLNEITDSGYSFASGFDNKIISGDGANSAFGRKGEIRGWGCAIFGNTCKATTQNFKLACGEYNADTAGMLFEVGNGDSNKRSNAFEVLKDGRARAYKAAQDPEDLVRKKEFDDNVGDIETALDSIIAIQNALIGGGV